MSRDRGCTVRFFCCGWSCSRKEEGAKRSSLSRLMRWAEGTSPCFYSFGEERVRGATPFPSSLQHHRHMEGFLSFFLAASLFEYWWCTGTVRTETTGGDGQCLRGFRFQAGCLAFPNFFTSNVRVLCGSGLTAGSVGDGRFSSTVNLRDLCPCVGNKPK